MSPIRAAAGARHWRWTRTWTPPSIAGSS